MANKLSPYAEKLNETAKKRYLDKLGLICGVDPFCHPASVSSAAPRSLPPVEASDLVSYLVLQTSFLTPKQFKAHKSLDAYNQFVCGWVKDVRAWSLDGKSVVTGRVRHSQRCNDTPLSCWIICENTGEICCAHCNCMAGLGEVCTHVAAVLFFLETSTRLNEKSTCTQEKCKWVVPSFQKEIPYLPVKDIDFTSAKGKKTKIDSVLSSDSTQIPPTTSNTAAVNSPDSSELQSLFRTLSECETKPAILSVMFPYASTYIPKASQPSFPQPLQTLFHQKYLKLDYIELLNACEAVEISITAEMAQAVEKETRAQSNSKLWFTYRAGRITASRMKSACCTDPANPAQSLVKVISYPESFKFMTKATSWGCKHENLARDVYTKKMMGNHHDFAVMGIGLVLNPKWPHIGASPDGAVSCSCCGKGIIEIKCPYCHRNNEILDTATQDKNFFLKHGSDGACYLDQSHAYYYQVQTQLFMCEVEYCDFVVCTFPAEDCEPNIYIERICANDDFWSSCIRKSSDFFRLCVLPELLGRWYSRPCLREHSEIASATTIDINPGESEANVSVYCYCRQPEEDEMIACDNPSCPIEWFHTKCLRIKAISKGKWYCPDCRKLPECRKGGVKRKRE